MASMCRSASISSIATTQQIQILLHVVLHQVLVHSVVSTDVSLSIDVRTVPASARTLIGHASGWYRCIVDNSLHPPLPQEYSPSDTPSTGLDLLVSGDGFLDFVRNHNPHPLLHDLGDACVVLPAV